MDCDCTYGVMPPFQLLCEVRPREAFRRKHPSMISIFLIGVGKDHWLDPPLPPNRTCGSPAYGSPVGGLTSKRIDETSMGRVQGQQPLLGNQGFSLVAPRNEGRQQALWPGSRFVLARSGDRGLSDAVSPSGVTGGALSFGFVRGFGHCVSTSLHPFAPPALPGFIATMGALTPARRFFVSLSGTMNSAWTRAGLSASCAWPSDHSASNHPGGPVIALSHYPSASRASGSLRSGLRLLLAGSPRGKAESSSLTLRTSRSPPVAPHPASRRRSYVRLQAGECVPEEDFHPSDQAHLQTH